MAENRFDIRQAALAVDILPLDVRAELLGPFGSGFLSFLIVISHRGDESAALVAVQPADRNHFFHFPLPS